MRSDSFALQHPVFFWGFVLLFVGALGALLYFSKRRSDERRVIEEEQERVRDEEQRKLVDAEIVAGRRLPDGRVACVVCQVAPATMRMPDIGLSALERLNPLRSLYGAVRLYRRTAGKHSQDPMICAIDHDVMCSMIDEELVACRRAVTAFCTNIDRHVARIRGGALIPRARQEAESRNAPLRPLEAAYAPLSQSPPRLVETTGDGVDPESESAQASR